MFITEHLQETREIIREQQERGMKVALVSLREALHPGKRALMARARSQSDVLVVAAVGAIKKCDFSSTLLKIDVFLSALGTAEDDSPEELFADVLRPDMVFAGEKDFRRLLRLEETVERMGGNVRVVRGGVFRDVDLIPFARESEAMSAEERFQARFIPLALRKAREMAERSGCVREVLMEQTLENLEKAGGLEVLFCELVDAKDASVYLCVSARAGNVLIRDSLRLW